MTFESPKVKDSIGLKPFKEFSSMLGCKQIYTFCSQMLALNQNLIIKITHVQIENFTIILHPPSIHLFLAIRL